MWFEIHSVADENSVKVIPLILAQVKLQCKYMLVTVYLSVSVQPVYKYIII